MDRHRAVKAGGKRQEVNTALSDEAIDWLVRLHSGRATEADHAAFAGWRALSEAHELAAREAEAIWSGIGLAGGEVRRTERKARVTRRAVLGGAGLLASGIVLERAGIIGPHLLADHVTGVGEQQVLQLADGSSVQMNGSTALSVEFTNAERRLRLFGGQAMFTVERDAARPFIVETDYGIARAVGTIFDVDIRPQESVVTVLEGLVDVATNNAPGEPVRAAVNQRVRYHSAGVPSAPEMVDSDVATAWRRGKLIFNRRPLGDVIAELARHRPGHIVVLNDQVRTLEVTGVFDLVDPEAVLQTIEATLPVRVDRLPLVTLVR